MNPRHIVLLSCSSRKLARRAVAAELYRGTLFCASLAWARQRSPDGIYILSALHHLVPLDQEIDPYDLTLNDLPAVKIREWADRVREQLEQVADLRHDRFEILAGEKYRRYLLPHLGNASVPLEGLPIGRQIQFLQTQLRGQNDTPDRNAVACVQLHRHLAGLKRHRFPFGTDKLPSNGIYILFEYGERAHGTDRIVRIGTHRSQGQLPGRLREHFVKENKDRSIFRKNIGRAMLNRERDPLLADWEHDLTTREARRQFAGQIDMDAIAHVERRVSEYIHHHLSFSVIEVPDREARLRIETGLIATIHACRECGPSVEWLGRNSPKRQIRNSGLWLVQGLDGRPLDEHEWHLVTGERSMDSPTPSTIAHKKRKSAVRTGRRPVGKYAPLHEYLSARNGPVSLAFPQLEEILGASLPPSARAHRPWWANHANTGTSPQSDAWQQAGYQVDSVRLGDAGWVRFRKARR